MTTIFLAGDSTVTNQECLPFAGWGQMFGLHFDDNVKVVNYAHSGCSSLSFIEQGRLARIGNELQKGDYLFIQFGHNDEKDNEWYSDPFTTFTDNLRIYIKLARDKSATPVLVTPVFRRLFCDAGVLFDSHLDYAVAVRDLAASDGVVLIDLHKRSGDLLEVLGSEASKDIFLHIGPGVYDDFPDGLVDDTHFSVIGAGEIAKLVVAEIVDKKDDLARFII